MYVIVIKVDYIYFITPIRPITNTVYSVNGVLKEDYIYIVHF